MTDSRQSWDEVAQQFRALGRHVKDHYRAQAPEGATAEGAERERLEQALRTLADAVSQAVEAVGASVRDPEFRDQAKKAAESLGIAVGDTFTGVGDEVRDRFGARAEGETSPAPASSPDPAETGEDPA